MTPRDNRCHKSYCSPRRSPHRPKQTDPTHAPVGFASARKNSRLLTTRGSHNIGLTPCQPAVCSLMFKLLDVSECRTLRKILVFFPRATVTSIPKCESAKSRRCLKICAAGKTRPPGSVFDNVTQAYGPISRMARQVN